MYVCSTSLRLGIEELWCLFSDQNGYPLKIKLYVL